MVRCAAALIYRSLEKTISGGALTKLDKLLQISSDIPVKLLL